MTFEILPAIDVAGGRLVSVAGGRTREVEAFGGSPLAAAEAFVAAGARWLHVVDVDRAQGRGADLGLTAELASLGARVQASGGIVSEGAARDAVDAGAARVVLGSAVLADADALPRLLGRLGDRIVVGIEADGEVIRPRSAAPVELPLGETLDRLRQTGPPRYLFTSVSRVARLLGPDLDGVRRTAAGLAHPVLAAGGIRDVEDVLALRALGEGVVEGVVLGRSLYEGLSLRRILAAAV